MQKAIEVLPDDTPETLQRRVMTKCEQIILPEAIRLIAQNKVRVENNIVRLLADPSSAGKEQS